MFPSGRKPGQAPGHRPPRRRTAGFTLIEALIGLVLVSIVFMLIVSATGLSGQAMHSAEQRINETESLLLTYRVLRQTVGRAYQLPETGGGESRPFLEGRPERLQFLALLPGTAQVGGVYEIEFRIVAAAGGGTELWLARRQFKTEKARGRDDGDRQDFLLYRGPRVLRFAYLPAKKGGKAPDWRDSAENDDDPPALVRLSEPSGEVAVWPALTVRPRIHPLAGCVQRPVARICTAPRDR